MVKCGRPAKGCEQESSDRLLDTALQLFLENGYGDLSMESLAREARVSLRTIYNQFGGKAGVFGALIRRCSDRFIGSLKDGQDGDLEQALVAFGVKFLFQISRPEVMRMRAILIAECQRFPDLAVQFYQEGPSRTLAHLAEFFSAQQRAGRIVADFSAQILADQYISALRGERMQRQQLGLEDAPDQAEIESWVKLATHLFLRGCCAP
ncbi:TetR/AcrR family transcriptional regulator [Methylomonas sp. HYX-M1]|uniref:TetR/AcrR family transcriptional regulator n=1 Tax=Methylomonas sp. HYX-M1 TaxID=3139307 RepID=UPI00345C22D3